MRIEGLSGLRYFDVDATRVSTSDNIYCEYK